jgi:tryptophan-rich sensory protein
MTNRHKSLVLFIVSVVGIGWLIGVTNLPGAWYAGLTKASFNPPNWIFGPVWTVIYVLIAIAGWRTYLQETPAALPMQLWYVQMVLNFIWSPVVFTLHSLGLGLAIILALLGVIVGFIAVQATDNRSAALFFVPYAAWVAFASVLNYSLYRLN